MSLPEAERPVFDALDRYTDAEFAEAIDQISGQGTVRFHADHLYYALRSRYRPPPPDSPVALWVFGVALLFFVVGGLGYAFGLPLFPAAIAIAIGLVLTPISLWLHPTEPPPEPKLEPATFRQLWDRWVAAYGEPAGLIPAVRPLPGPTVATEELEGYSFDRVVITDRAATTETLLANDFHFENNCAVLSIDGHPSHAFHLVRKMLRGNPNIEVYALHDASQEGLELAQRLANEPSWFAGLGRVFDLGLSMDDAKRLGGGYYAPIEILSPEQLVKRVFRAMQDLPAAVAAGTIVVADGITSLAEPSGTSDGGGDSFG